MRAVEIAVALCEAETALAKIDLRGHSEPIRDTTWAAILSAADAYRKWLARCVEMGVYPSALPFGLESTNAEYRVRCDLTRMWEQLTPTRIDWPSGLPAEKAEALT